MAGGDIRGQRPFSELSPHDRRRHTARTAFTIATVICLTLLAYAVSPAEGAGTNELATRVVVVLLLIVGAAILAVRSVIRAEYPMLRAVEAFVAVLSLLIVAFAYVYLVSSSADPAAFSEPLDHIGALYFTITTTTTVGFGDITPKSNPVRIVVMVQMICNVVLIGAVARLLIGVARQVGNRT